MVLNELAKNGFSQAVINFVEEQKAPFINSQGRKIQILAMAFAVAALYSDQKTLMLFCICIAVFNRQAAQLRVEYSVDVKADNKKLEGISDSVGDGWDEYLLKGSESGTKVIGSVAKGALRSLNMFAKTAAYLADEKAPALISGVSSLPMLEYKR